MSGFFSVHKSALIGAVGLASLAAGCATAPQGERVATYGAPAGAHYTAADRLYRDRFVDNTRPFDGQTAPLPEATVLAAYEGVSGARLAHQLYGEAQAEKLDGACERFVKIVQGENLYDIAKYCDVPVEMLASLNPVIGNPSHVGAGQIIEVPQLFNAERHLLAMEGREASVRFASWYVTQPGDTLNDIAARHLVSAGDVAVLNPGVDWGYVPAGLQVKIPAPEHAAPAPQAPATSSLPYDFGPGRENYVPPAEVTAVMPYMMKPAHAPAADVVAKEPVLTIDRRTVNPGGVVNVSAVGLPANTVVSLYQGPNGEDLDFVAHVTTDARGEFQQPVTVKGSANIGGVIFRAMVDSTGAQLQSPRVGVDKIKAPAEN